jgi:hypothetical protein
LRANVSNISLLDLSDINLSIDNFKIPNVTENFIITNNSLSTSELDEIIDYIINNNIIIGGWNSSGNALPSSAKQTAISALCTANDSSATFQ